ncbi:ankyrin repeat domain-containing protein [Undibacterium umbellatum]|uniref:Ankyrin repeat domain-containing protein n=1 Tax=Undibacterium umbellatum TaxID=2762300 RepID=A0ABR6ZDG4_9BURK|nr:ankyrin repeat domain-containing protein [Undibacterium umbellatum]MBC3909669.1 ankyrin repeat domain-containing protein [Undibacterium umbellatum]
MTTIKTISSKLGASLFALVFVIGFGAGGLFGGVLPMSRQVQGWWRADELVAVLARVDQLRMDEHRGKSKTLRVVAEFVYQYNGRTYRSNRINIAGDGSDNIGSYHQDTYARLQQARDSQQKVTLWLDPQEPEFAVYDKTLRLSLFLFLIPFATLFPAVSLGALWALWAIWCKADKEETQSAVAVTPGQQLAGAQSYAAGRLELQADNSGALGLGLFALFWNLLSFPIAGVVLLQDQQGSQWGWLVLVFPLAGIFLMWAAGKIALARWRLGKVSLSLTQQPYTGIDNLAVRLHIEPGLGLRLQTASTHYPVQIQVQCVHEDRRGEDTTTKTLWAQELGERHVVHGAQSLDFSISLPADMPISGILEHKEVEVIWKLQIKVLDAELSFKLPVRQGMGGQVNARDVLEQQYPREPINLFGFPRTPEGTKQQTRNWFWAYGIFFVLIAITAFAIFNSASEDSTQQRSTQQRSTDQAQTLAQTETFAQLKARLATGADVNAGDAEGRSLLMQAVDEVSLEKVRYLLEQGAKVDLATPVDADGHGGRTAVFAAIDHDAVEIVQALADADADLRRPSNKVWTPVHYAAYKGALKSLRYLHQRGLAIDEVFNGGRGSTPLMVAAQYNQLPAIAFLLQAGADRSKKDLYGEDACGYARFFKQEAAAKALDCQ